MPRFLLVLLLALAACVATACAAASPSVATQPTAAPAPADPLSSPGGTDHWLGAPDAPITVEEYGDLQ